MMEKIRTAANNIVVKIIFGIIILAFIFTGVGGFLGFSSNSANDERLYIAKVDGEGINRAVFEREVQQAAQNSGTLLGDNNELQKMLRQSILSSQIDDYLSYQFSNSLGTKISDQQVKNMIIQQSVFFENNRFSNDRYLKLLAASGYTPESYADALRSAIQKQQVMKAIILSDFVTPKDLDISALINQTRTVYATDYTLANIKDDFEVSNSEVKDYYDKHPEQFNHPARLKMKYVINPYPEIEKSITVSDDEIEKYYSQGKEGTMSPEKHLYSVTSFDSLAKADEQYQAMTKMDSEHRLDVPMDSIGWFSVNEQLPDLLTQEKLIETGSISKPIAQSGSYYIVRLDAIEASKKLPFDYAKNTILNLLRKEKTDKIYDEQQHRLEKAAKLASMEEIAKVSGLKLYESKWTTQNEALSIGRFPTIRDLVFSDLMVKDGKPTGIISDIIYAPEYLSTFIIQVTDYEEAGIAPFDEVKDSIKDNLLTQKKKEVFNDNVNKILAQLREQGSVKGIQFAQRITVARQSTDAVLDQPAIDKIFSIVPDANNQGYGAAIQDTGKAKLFALTEVKNGEPSDISGELKTESSKTDQYYLLSDLRSKAKIEVMPNANL